MKGIGKCSTVVLCWLGLLYSPVYAADTIGTLGLEYEILRTEALKPLGDLDQLYIEKVEGVKSEAESKGQKDRVAAALEALEHVGTGDDYEVDLRWRDLSKYQRIYLKARDERLGEVAVSVTKVDAEFSRRFEDLAEQLDSETESEDVVKIEAIIREIAGRAERDLFSNFDLSAMSTPERVFDFAEGSYPGVAIGDSEEKLLKAFEEAGVEIVAVHPFREAGRNLVSDDRISFRFDAEGRFVRAYVVGESAKLQDGQNLGDFSVSDFEKLVGQDAEQMDPVKDHDKYTVVTDGIEFDLLTIEQGDDRVFSVMVSEI